MQSDFELSVELSPELFDVSRAKLWHGLSCVRLHNRSWAQSEGSHGRLCDPI
jgi:hypothetical protein